MTFIQLPFAQRSWRALVVLALLSVAMPAHAQRVALLVGNATYSVGRLTNPPNDVATMEKALGALGFKVQKVLNANQNQMKRAVRDFGSAAQGAEVAFLYYSGHGTQANGENYLLPVGASIEKESDYPIEAIAANDVLAQIRGAQPKAAILVLDACRDNPLAAVTKSATKGLGRMSAPTGTMIAFATAPGDTASDNGHYARVLAKEIQKPGQELVDVFRNTAAEVRKLSASGKVQDPRISEMSINERLYLAGTPGPGTQIAGVRPETNGTPIAPITPTIKPGQAAGLSLDDLEKEEATRKEWAAWQSKMKADFDKTAAFQGSADLQAKAWDRFLTNWSQDNPLSREDEALREEATRRRGALLGSVSMSGNSNPQNAGTEGTAVKSLALKRKIEYPLGVSVYAVFVSDDGRFVAINGYEDECCEKPVAFSLDLSAAQSSWVKAKAPEAVLKRVGRGETSTYSSSSFFLRGTQYVPFVRGSYKKQEFYTFDAVTGKLLETYRCDKTTQELEANWQDVLSSACDLGSGYANETFAKLAEDANKVTLSYGYAGGRNNYRTCGKVEGSEQYQLLDINLSKRSFRSRFGPCLNFAEGSAGKLVSSSGERFLRWNGKTYTVGDWATGKPVSTIQNPEANPDGTFRGTAALVQRGARLWVFRWGRGYLYDTSTGALLRKAELNRNDTAKRWEYVLASADGELLFSDSYDRTSERSNYTLFDATGRPLGALAGLFAHLSGAYKLGDQEALLKVDLQGIRGRSPALMVVAW